MFMIKDAEAAIYAIEAAVNLFTDISNGNYISACLNSVQLVGWFRNMI